MTAILYSFRRCPYAMRGRMALHISEAAYEHREVILRDKPEAMLAASPKGTVPVFITDGGDVKDESLDIMLWALGRHDPLGWLSCDRAAAKDLIAANDGPFKHHLDRYKYASRYQEDAKRGDIDITHREQAETHLTNLEARLSQHANLLSAEQSLADIAIFPFIRQFANTDRAWWDSKPYPHVHAWLERHLASGLFKDIMTKHPIWIDPNALPVNGPNAAA